MENCTYCSVDGPNLGGPGFGAFLIIGLLLVTTVIVVYVTIIIALCVSHFVAKLIRIFLINLLVAGVLFALIGTGFILSGLVLNFTSLPPPDLGFCRFLLWGYTVGAIARLYCLAGFSIVVLLIVRYNKKEMKTLHIVLFLALIWCVTILQSVHFLVPSLYPVRYYDGVACFPSYSGTVKGPVFFAIFIIFGELTPLTISFVVPIVIFCYVRGNTITEGSPYNKGMAKFTLLVVAGNLIDFVGQAVVALLVFLVANPFVVYLSYLIPGIFLIPTPIMILIFMKPLRTQVTKVIRCTKIPSICRILKTSTTVE